MCTQPPAVFWHVPPEKLHKFRETIRNPYNHYNIKTITRDVLAEKVKKLDLNTGHVEEIDIPIEVEETDKRVAYFRQAENGLWIRAALLLKVLGKA